MAVTLTGYGGVNEIGGTKLLLEDESRRLFFDFGRSFGRYESYFDGVFIKERSSRGLLDLLTLGLIPPLRGLLRQDLIPGLDPAHLNAETVPPTGRQKNARQVVSISSLGQNSFWEHWQRRFPQSYRDLRREAALAVDAVLLSHAHQDHISDLVYLDPAIPAISTRLTAFISRVLADVGQDGQGAPYCNPYILDTDGSLAVDRDSDYIGRPWRFVEGDLPPEVTPDLLQQADQFWKTSAAARKGLTHTPCVLPASIYVRHWPVDHSIFGATGYAVETSAGWVAYTGDLRMHGKYGWRSHAFAEALAALRPAALLCEGTRLMAEQSTTEGQVHDTCLKVVQEAQGQYVVADFAPRNVERLETFADIASATGRRLLVQPKDAYLLVAMHLAAPSDVPDWMAHPTIALYSDPKISMRPWEEQVRQRFAGRTVDHRAVSASPGDYILAFSLTDIADLIDIHTLLGDTGRGVYIFSNSQAYDEEQTADLVRLWHWTQLLGLRLVGLRPPRYTSDGKPVVETEAGYHSSGHAGRADLADFVRIVNPKTLIPIHTEVAHLWASVLDGTGINIIVPDLFQPIRLT